MAFAALLRTHEVVREVEEGFVRQTIRHGSLAARVVVVLVTTAEFNPLFVTVGHRELTDDATFLEVLEIGVVRLEVIPEGLVLSDIAVEGARKVNRRLVGGSRSFGGKSRRSHSGRQAGGQRQKLGVLGHD